MSLPQLWSFLGIALPALAALLVPMPSIDLTYQLRAGAEILAGNGIPTVDTWTFTAAGVPWLDQQWSAQVLLAAVYQVAGWTGLALLRAGLVALAFGLLGATLRSIGCGARPAAILTLLAFALAAPALALRPQLFAITLFAATTWILVRRREHPRRLWLIPVLAVAWANLHGSFPLVIVLVGLAWLDEVLRRRPVASPAGASEADQPQRVLGSTGIALIGAISAVATLVTPFGIDTWRYVVGLASNPAVSGRVSEWRPPSPIDPAGAVFYVSLLAALVIAAIRVRADGGLRRDRLAWIASILAFGALGVVTGRGLAWWALAMPVAAANLAHEGGLTAQLPRSVRGIGALFRDAPPRRSTRGNRLNGVVAAVLILAGVALLPLWRPLGPTGVPEGTLSYAPQAIAFELRTLQERAGYDDPNAWVPQAWGSWLEWAVPGLQYNVDSRIELFPARLWDDVERVAAGAADLPTILDAANVRIVVLSPEQRAAAEPALQRLDFFLRYEGAEGAIWVRRSG